MTLAARMLPLADGSDLGGSLRNPAELLQRARPSPHTGPRTCVSDTESVVRHVGAGPMARSVDDIALFLSVLVGDDPRVPVALTDPGATFYPVTPLDLRGIRVALTTDLGLPVQARDQGLHRRDRRLLESLGATVEAAYPDLSGRDRGLPRAARQRFRERFARCPPRARATERHDPLEPRAGEALTVADLDRAWATRRAIYERTTAFFGRYDFLIGPTTQVLPFDVDAPYPTEIDGVAMKDYLAWMQSCARITVTGCPALSLPAGFSSGGLPIGMQIVAPVRAEARLLAFAKTVEAATGYAQMLRNRSDDCDRRYTARP